MGQFEDVEDLGGGGDDTEFAAADLHVAVEDHEGSESGAIYEFDAGEIKDESFNAVVCGVADPD